MAVRTKLLNHQRVITFDQCLLFFMLYFVRKTRGYVYDNFRNNRKKSVISHACGRTGN